MKSKIRFVEAVIFTLLCLVTPLNAFILPLHADGNQIKDSDGNVVVLRGVCLIDLGFLEAWEGGAINMIDRLTNKLNSEGNSPGWYTRVVRIPIVPADAAPTWPNRFNPNNDDFYNDLLRPVVDYCRTKGLYAIIDWHYVAPTVDHVASTSEFWEYMAPKFADDDHVIFELYNEPNDPGSSEVARWLTVRANMQTWIDIVRSYAPNNLILVAGPSYSQEIGYAATYPLTGDNIVMVSHIYPWHWHNVQSWCTWHIDTCLTRYPVFMSEWGFYSNSSDTLGYGSITNYGQPLMNFREARKISNTAWVASYDWKPPMFNTDWTLRVGEWEMGGFVKDKLYEKRHDDQPGGPGDVTPPSVPAGVSATPGFATVSLDWNNNTEGDLAGYNVYRSTTSGSGYSKLNGYFLSDSNYADVNVFVGTTYYYVVTAIDTNYNESDKSSEVSATPIGSTIVYTFADINQADTNYNAYACDVDQFPFNGNSANRNTMVEASDQEYVNISANDTAEWAPVNPDAGDETFLWIEMKIDESP
ncbi:MAG: cellulase family glycosylhydrolase, partial [Sedimentisphaerales bacterium]|nr:cellulase family glycosylhydrolase [Sedimentisphaerales bacterium]